jgi:hypothetical protein
MTRCKLSEFGECRQEFTSAKEWAEFCCTEHRKRWHYLARKATAYREAVEDAEAQRANGHANGHDAEEVREKITLAALGLASPKVEPKRRRPTAA